MSHGLRRGQSRLQPRRYEIKPIADATGEFLSFAPYVAAVNDDGMVAFQATRRDGTTGVYTGDTRSIRTNLTTASGPYASICSHPDLDADGRIICYVELHTGSRAVVVAADGTPDTLALDAGPLGPTMNDAGGAAFRTAGPGMGEGIWASRGRSVARVAATGDRFSTFHGLPIVNAAGLIEFRADLTAGGSAICLAREDMLELVVQTGSIFESLGPFPVLGDDGAVGFCARRVDGDEGVFVISDRRLEVIVDTTASFESFRGVLLGGDGSVVFYATPRGGQLGIFSGLDPLRDCILGIGTPLFGSIVVEFALNPVSINRSGQLAIRARLADDSQWIVRVDPLARFADSAFVRS